MMRRVTGQPGRVDLEEKAALMARHVYRVDSPVVGKLHAYFGSHPSGFAASSAGVPPSPPGEAGAGIADTPSREHIAALVNAAFWASLVSVEGRPTTLSIAYVSPEQTESPFKRDD